MLRIVYVLIFSLDNFVEVVLVSTVYMIVVRLRLANADGRIWRKIMKSHMKANWGAEQAILLQLRGLFSLLLCPLPAGPLPWPLLDERQIVEV